MNHKSALAAAAAAGLAVTSVAAEAAAQPLPARGSEQADTEQLGGGGFLVPLLAIAAIILGILAMTGGDGDDLPVSP